MKAKTSCVEKRPLEDNMPVISVGEENHVFADLAATLAEIRKLKGVRGYILRNNNAAIVDFTEKEAFAEYSMLSWQIHEYSHRIAKEFNLVDVGNVLVEGGKVKVVCISIGPNRMSIFMDKSCSHSWIIKRILI